jgi:2-polyprenyl-6-hydroxyphenyl methylase/3-demethylubiquinone-9 3-methyltransferase
MITAPITASAQGSARPAAAPPANVDAAEIAKFAAQAHHWWDPDSALFGPLHRMNPLRVAWIESVCGPLAGKRVVDVGCGGGILSEGLAARGARVLGIDVGEKALGVARLHQLESGSDVEYRLTAAEALAATEPGAFDVVTCLELLEHVPDPAAIVAACGALARPGGAVVVATINRNPKAYALAVVAAEYVLGLLPRGTHDYAKFLTPSEVAAFARRAGLAGTAITGVAYNPLDKSFRLTGDASVNYMMAFARAADV